MKKFLCMLLAVLSIGCLVGCTDHDDDKCDECKKETSLLNPVIRWEDKKELCLECAENEYGPEEFAKLIVKFADAIEAARLDD